MDNRPRRLQGIESGFSFRDRIAMFGWQDITGARLSLATKLVLSFLLIIVLVSALFVIVGVRLIGDRVIIEAEEKVRHDLNAAREIYLSRLEQIHDVVRFTAERHFLRDALITGDVEAAGAELAMVRDREGLDILSITDGSGNVLLRTTNPSQSGDDRSDDALIRAALSQRRSVAASAILPADELRKESDLLAEMACCTVIDTPMARASDETELKDGMIMEAAAPILDAAGNLIGALYGGVLLNKDFEIVDKIKGTVFQNLQYKGKDIGTVTIFQDDVRVSTNVTNADGSRAIGTRVSEQVYDRVIQEGMPWIGRAYVVDDWYISAYEPIRDFSGEIIGMLYVGMLEQKYVDIRNRGTIIFLGITLMGVLISMLLSYFISKRISVPVMKLVSASRAIAQGNLDTKVEIRSKDELGELADSFNSMASALKERDKQLKEFTTSRIMESERLALIGQLSANVAHELNNPLQGIVTYSHLLLERAPSGDAIRTSVQKIVTQADRCKDIIRGLLDFARQRKPDKTVCDITSIMEECVGLVENQALFFNIQVEKHFEDHLPTVIVDPSQMQQVIINLLINAAEAMEGEGKLTLATRYDPEEGTIELEFADTGQGIPADDLERIFDPFFTTKEVGHGTGLGLAISYGIIKEHGSTISVESEMGKGTTFVVRIPVT